MSVFLNGLASLVNLPLSNWISDPIPTLEPTSVIDARASYKGEIFVNSDYILIENNSAPDSIQVWNKHTLTLERNLELTQGRESSDSYHVMKVVGSFLWLIRNDGPCGGADLQLWDLSSGHLIKKINTNCLCAIDDSCLIQTHYQWNNETKKTETQIKIWNPANGELLGSLENFESSSFGYHPMSLSCKPVFQRDSIITGHDNGSVHVRSKLDGRSIGNFSFEEEDVKKRITSLVASEDVIIWGDDRGIVRSSKIVNESDVKIFNHPNNDMAVSKLELSDDFLIGEFSSHKKPSCLTVWSIDSGALLYSHEYNSGQFLIHGNRLALYKADENIIHIFDKREGTLIVSITDLAPKCWNFKIFDNLIIIPGLNDHLQIRNLETGTLLSEIKASRNNFTIDGQQLIAFEAEEVANVLIFDLSVFR